MPMFMSGDWSITCTLASFGVFYCFACTLDLGSLGSEHSRVSVDAMRHDHFLEPSRREKRSSELESTYDNGVSNEPVYKFVNAAIGLLGS